VCRPSLTFGKPANLRHVGLLHRSEVLVVEKHNIVFRGSDDISRHLTSGIPGACVSPGY
jgi:hypothetical protein